MAPWTRLRILLPLGLCACMTEPDQGGQEGEEIRGGGPPVVDTGDSYEEGSGGDGGDGETTDTAVDDSMVAWTLWSGLLTSERGLTESAGERDCILAYQMQGSPSPLECDGCIAVFDVLHVLDPAATEGRDACPEAPEAYAATYAISGSSDDIQVWIGDGSGGFVELAEGVLEDDRLRWTRGEADVPEGSGDDLRYRTLLETADVQLR